MLRLSLRMKILLSVGVIIFVVLGTNTFLHVRAVRQYYLEAIGWRSEGLAQGLLNTVQSLQNYNPHYAENVQALLEKLTIHCQRLYELNKDKHISHIAVINTEGVISAHNDAEIIQTSVSPILLSELQQQHLMTVLDQHQYHTLIPVLDSEQTLLGTIDIGVPQDYVQTHIQQMLFNTLQLFVLFLGTAIVAITVLMRSIVTRPIHVLARIGKKIARGELIEQGNSDSLIRGLETIHAHDELGLLSDVFQRMIHYLQNVASVATQISNGNLQQQIKPKSQRDVLGNAFSQMTNYLKEMSRLASHIAQGDLRPQITLHSEDDLLGTAFLHMQQGLRALIEQIRVSANEIAAASMNILDISSQNYEALEQIGNSADVTTYAVQQVSLQAEEVQTSTEHLSITVEETSASVNQMISSIKHVAQNSRSLAQFADDTLRNVSEIMNSLEQIAEQAEHSKAVSETTTQDALSGQNAVEQVMTSMTTISEVTANLSEIIIRLQNRSSEIGTILDVINEVAEQTSLLALNASIIAAQAGTHGRGFAVVADEIKGLAIRVRASTGEISSLIKAVQHDSKEAVDMIARGEQHVQQGVNVAHTAEQALQQIGQSAGSSSQVAAQIAAAVHQQTTAHTQIATSLQDVSDMINEMTKATQEQERKSSELFVVVENMQNLEAQVSQMLKVSEQQRRNADSVTELMDGITGFVKKNSETVHNLAEVANVLAFHADGLKQQIARFQMAAAAGY